MSALNPDQLAQALSVSEAMVHRGPDGLGHFSEQNVAMMHRRLSIIGLVDGGQPLRNENGDICLIANAEIYNYIELRNELQARGHSFRTGSDCEVIVHLYEEFGRDCVRHLRGMFAFALWDCKSKTLLLGRDRMGEKPLYLVETPEAIVFASELKALLRARVVPFDLNPHEVNRYFHYGFVPEPRTIITNVRKLPAASTLTVSLRPWSVQEHRYWRMLDAPPIEGDPKAAIGQELDVVGKLVVRSDVPIGVALSGGLDSSVIAALACRAESGTIHAFSLGYEGRPRHDERCEAKQLASHFGMPFHEIELGVRDVVKLFPQANVCRDDPIADISGVSYLAIMRAARSENVPVMLMGQGGDELFWGYAWVRSALEATRRKVTGLNAPGPRIRDYLRFKIPPLSYTAGLQWLRSMGGVLSGLRQYGLDRSSPASSLVLYEMERNFMQVQRAARNAMCPEFLSQVQDQQLRECEYEYPAGASPVTSVMEAICQSYLMQNGLAQGDRLSMASSVELRLPLVDYRLVEVVVGLGKSQQGRGLVDKGILRKAVHDVLPSFVLSRKKKGFSPPWRRWMSAIGREYGEQLVDGVLVNCRVLRKDAAARLSRRVATPWWGGADTLAERALTLESWASQVRASLL